MTKIKIKNQYKRKLREMKIEKQEKIKFGMAETESKEGQKHRGIKEYLTVRQILIKEVEEEQETNKLINMTR